MKIKSPVFGYSADGTLHVFLAVNVQFQCPFIISRKYDFARDTVDSEKFART